MIRDYQRYEVTVKFSFEAEVFPEDPDDVYELAALEKDSVRDSINTVFEDVQTESLSVEPIITTLAQG